MFPLGNWKHFPTWKMKNVTKADKKNFLVGISKQQIHIPRSSTGQEAFKNQEESIRIS